MADDYRYPMTANPAAVPGGEIRNRPDEWQPGDGLRKFLIERGFGRLLPMASFIAPQAQFPSQRGTPAFDAIMARKLVERSPTGLSFTGGRPQLDRANYPGGTPTPEQQVASYTAYWGANPMTGNVRPFAHSSQGLAQTYALNTPRRPLNMSSAEPSRRAADAVKSTPQDLAPMSDAQREYLNALLSQRYRGTFDVVGGK